MKYLILGILCLSFGSVTARDITLDQNKNSAIIGAQATPQIVLQVKNKQIIVAGKKVNFKTIEDQDGNWGYTASYPGVFNVLVENLLAESTIIHWHGLILPNDQDGVAGLTQPFPIAPGKFYHYNFPLKQTGTYWMHSHYGFQEQQGVAAPIIITEPEDKNYQQIVVMFQDFSFKTPESIMALLKHNQQGSLDNSMSQESINHDMNHMNHQHTMANMGDMDKEAMAMDLNDVKYDAYLTNYHTPSEPQISKVKPGGLVKLRFINGSAMTGYWIDLGQLTGRLVAVDGRKVIPIVGRKFQLSEGQRADIIVKIPSTGGSYPVLGQVEGLKNQTGLILTTKEHALPDSIPLLAAQIASPLDYQQELQLKSKEKFLTTEKLSRITLNIKLSGNMADYIWQINNQSWPNVTPLKVSEGQLVTMVFDNQSMMAHPMHLHGYQFKVVNINGKPINGAVRDTILVLPHSKVTVKFVADKPGKWLLHCHMLYHMHAGMMTYLEVEPRSINH